RWRGSLSFRGAPERRGRYQGRCKPEEGPPKPGFRVAPIPRSLPEAIAASLIGEFGRAGNAVVPAIGQIFDLTAQRQPVSRPSCRTALKKREGATGSLAIIASDRAPSHPCGVTQRIGIDKDVPLRAANRHVYRSG